MDQQLEAAEEAAVREAGAEQDSAPTAEDSQKAETVDASLDPLTLDALDSELLRLVGETAGVGDVLHEVSMERFERLAAELVVMNERMNLTRLTSREEIAIQHVCDSLIGLRVIEGMGHSPRVIDVGSGAGFPGLALAVAKPTWHVTLLDARSKVVNWLAHAAQVLELDRVSTKHGRAEDVGQERGERGSYDVAVARAVAGLPTLLELTLPLVREGGLVVAWKGESADEEVKEASNALSILGGRVKRRFHYQLPGLDHERVLVVVEKRRKTPKTFPRRAGTPKRKPL